MARRNEMASEQAAETVSGTTPEDEPVSYTHLRAHETVLDLVCRLLLENKNHTKSIKTTDSD